MRSTIRLGFVSASLLLSACSDAGAEPGAIAIGKLDCGASVDGLHFEYVAVEYSNGDVWTSCSVEDGYAESGESAFWFAGSLGADEGACLVTLDVSGEVDGGWWAFSYAGSTAEMIYNDPDEPGNGQGYVFFENACTYTEPM